MGRPKLKVARTERLYLRLTKDELEEICKIAKKLKITRTEAVLRGIKLLKNPPRQIMRRSQMPGFVPKKIPKHSEGIIIED